METKEVEVAKAIYLGFLARARFPGHQKGGKRNWVAGPGIILLHHSVTLLFGKTRSSGE